MEVGVRITKLRREHGHWEANVSAGGETVPVTRRFGCWGTVPTKDGQWSDVKFEIALELARKVNSIERAEKRSAA